MFSINISISILRLAINLFEKLVNLEPFGRYTAEEACDHPWMTRRINDDVPLTANEIWIYFDLEQSLSRVNVLSEMHVLLIFLN